MTHTNSGPPVHSRDTAKLTRSYLMSMAEGLFVVSGCHEQEPDGQCYPVFSESVASLGDRDAQWARIKAAHADGRNCHVFEGADQFEAWKKTVHGAPWNRT